MTAYDPHNRRYDIFYLFDVKDGNPNGDPDAGNLPRQDPETGQGIVSDVSIKRRLRDWILMAKGDQSPFRIYVARQSRGGKPLEEIHKEAYDATQETEGKSVEKIASERTHGGAPQRSAREWLCKHFFDIRTLGAVLAGKAANGGQITGPLQFTPARSIDPIHVEQMTITRVAKSNLERAEKGGDTEMGNKALTYYGLYACRAFVSPSQARQTGFGADDLDLVLTAMSDLFIADRTASRGEMSVRGLYVFEHDCALGRARANDLFDRIVVGLREPKSPRLFSDYSVTIDETNMPEGVTLHRLVG